MSENPNGQPPPDPVVEIAREELSRWRQSSDVSAQTRAAQSACREWQRRVQSECVRPDMIVEARLGDPAMNQCIDLVDAELGVAYEMKASANNPHHEFFKDVFKALIFNETHPKDPLNKLVFIIPAAGARKLDTAFVRAVSNVTNRLGLEVQVVAT